MSNATLIAAHERRLAALDPLLRRTFAFPDTGSDDMVLTTDGGVALLRRYRPHPETLLAAWGAADQHQLSVRVAGPDPAAAMDGLLNQCRALVLAETAGDPDSEVSLTWPSRDTALTRTFLAHGLIPTTVIAARPTGRPDPGGSAEVEVRPMREDDLDAAAALWLELVRWDAQFGTARERPSTAAAIRDELREALSNDPQWCWVAGGADAVHGMLVVQPPERAEWIARLTSHSPVAYLSCLVVTAGHRGAGAGAALVRRAHQALDAAGVQVTLLHYGAMNPLSAPFWHRCGYRPLWTLWQAQPAARLRPPA